MPERHERIESRWQALKNERSSWYPRWQDITDYIIPYAGRYNVTDRNQGKRRDVKIYDNTATRAAGTLGAGLMSGMSSPSSPWFKLIASNPDLNKRHNVKVWMEEVSQLMMLVFTRSNTYRALHTMYEEMGAFGTACSMLVPDYKNVIHIQPFTAGEYALAAGEKGLIDTLYREVQMTVAQMVHKFGHDKVSQTVRNMYDRGNMDAWVTVLHAIEPRRERDSRRRNAQNMPWRSVYLEPGQQNVLSESGFNEFRAMCPRWIVTGRDVYGHGPGMEALGDTQQLQFDQTRKSKGVDYQTDPPLQAPTAYKYADLDTLPGGMSYVDAPQAGGGIRPAMQVNFDINGLLGDIYDIRARIQASFFTDLFRMLENHTSPQMTAYEVAERKEEKLLMLGPVWGRAKDELHDPLVENTFAMMVEAGILPPPPQELQGQDLAVEYISVVAQAQKAAGVKNIDRYVTALGAVAEYKPGVLDKFDSDEWADVYGDRLGVDPNIIVPGPQVALIRKQRAQQEQQAEQMERISQAAGVAKDLASADTGGQNALTDVAKAISQ